MTDPQTVHSEAAAAWPDVHLDREIFRQRVAEAEAVSPGGCTRPVELYLAVACVEGDLAAIRHFDAAYLAKIPQFISKFRFTTAEVDDLQQVIRMRLLTGARPKLASYTGVGSLEGWVRIVAVRLALEARQNRKPSEELLDDDALLRLAPEAPVARDPSMASLLDGQHRPAIKTALNTALLELPVRDRTVLRMYAVDGVSIDAIGIVYRVHRATVARWLVSIRTQLLKSVGRQLKRDLGASRSSVVSLVRVLQFDVDLSLSRVLDGEPSTGV